ncbi:MAG: NAD-dependent epimerase/dehydratase family protein [Candidatus Aminicenantes bacterium]|nr:NAD-dependent epimerase/dehydratase family protein [Candidatus Aminicenantes bacterium]
MRTKILITGACGQIGSELTLALRERYGRENVIASDIVEPSSKLKDSGPFELIDCTNFDRLVEIVSGYGIQTVYHLAAILSAAGEANPQLAWKVNIDGLYNVMEIARQSQCDVFAASSPAVFGPNVPKDNTPQDVLLRPTNIYGVTKVAGELLCDYYHLRYGLDTRGLRFSGVISYETIPQGGITDYAVEMCYEAIKNKKYTCFLRSGTYLPFMYIKDAIKAAIQVMEANPDKLIHRNAYNVTAVCFEPEMVADEIKKYIPEFVLDYDVDPVRQGIADSGTRGMDDTVARKEWGWDHTYDLPAMVRDMLENISKRLNLPL